jgi:hypothetical protein
MKEERSMRRSATALLAVLLLLPTAAFAERIEKGNLITEGIPEIPEEITRRLQQYQNTRSAALRGWHPSGEGLIISTRFGETSQLHWVKTPGGARHQLTFLDEPVGETEVVPGAAEPRLILGLDVGGSENYQLHTYDLADASLRLLTDGKSRNGGATVSNAGDRLVSISHRGE